MAGAKLDLTTDTSQFKKGMKGAEDIIESVGETFDDLAKDAEGASDKMERSFADYARETKQEASKLGREVSGSQDKAAVDVDKANEKMATSGQSKAREVAASFDGSAESIVSGFQGAAAEMFEGFGPAGAAAGLAAAAGLGLITAEFQKQQEEADATAERVDAMVSDMISAQTTYVTEMDRLNALEAFLGDAEARKEAQVLADTLGVPLLDVAQGLFDLNGKREVIEGKITENYKEQREALRVAGGDAQIIATEQRRILGVMEDQLAIMNRYDEDLKLAGDLARIYFQTQEDVTDELAKQKQALLDNHGYVIDIGNEDATPKFTFKELALGQINDVQAALNRLKAPRLTVEVDRVIR